MPETRADRLKSLLLKALPDQKDKIESGEWGPDEVNEAGEKVPQCPYSFRTLNDGRRQLTIKNKDTGDVIGVTGATHEELFNKMEARLA